MDNNNIQLSEQAAKDLHLIAAPVRMVDNAVQLVLFILVLPVVFLYSFVKYVLTGEPIMTPDECRFAQPVCLVVCPVLVGMCFGFYERRRRNNEEDYKLPLGMFKAMFLAIPLLYAFLWCSGKFDLGYLGSTSTLVVTSPLWVPLVGLICAFLLGNALRADEILRDPSNPKMKECYERAAMEVASKIQEPITANVVMLDGVISFKNSLGAWERVNPIAKKAGLDGRVLRTLLARKVEEAEADQQKAQNVKGPVN
jgi:hypothetical protein